MKLVVSPAKSLDFIRGLPTESNSKACFLKEAESLNNILREKSPQDLSELMSISPSLAELNYQRNNSWLLVLLIQDKLFMLSTGMFIEELMHIQ